MIASELLTQRLTKLNQLGATQGRESLAQRIANKHQAESISRLLNLQKNADISRKHFETVVEEAMARLQSVSYCEEI